jgi:signal peptidase I
MLPLPQTLTGLLSSARFRVEGDSMYPALQRGQHLLVHRVRSSDSPLQRGDVVALRHPADPQRIFIKRVIGLPGEHLRLAEDAVYVNDLPLAEPYLDGPPCPVGRYARQWVVAPDEYFVLGDHRSDSQDSRAFGAVGQQMVLGRVWFRCWPPRAWGRVLPAGAVSRSRQS